MRPCIKFYQSEVIIFEITKGSTYNNASKSFEKRTTDSLKVIVQNYQKGDALGAEQLRQRFYPLIYKLSHRHSMYSAFGEDAENIAWLLFYEFIFSYQGEDYVRLPGLVRRFLIFRLLRKMQQQGMKWDMEELLQSESLADSVAECEAIQKFLNDTALRETLQTLPDKQLLVLIELYFNNNTQDVTARKLNCTKRSVRYYKDIALNELKRKLET